MASTIVYEIKVQYDGREWARFVESEESKALALANSLGRLPATTRVKVNKLVVEQIFSWEK